MPPVAHGSMTRSRFVIAASSVLAALITQGSVDARLKVHVRWALDHGATPGELEALATLLAVYAGFPRASLAMETIRQVLADERV